MIDDFKPVRPKQRPPTTRPTSGAGNHTENSPDKVDKLDGTTANDIDVPADLSMEHEQQDTEFRVKTASHNAKKRWLIVGGILAATLIVAGAVYWFYFRDTGTEPTTQTAAVKAKVAEKQKIYSPLTGVEVTDVAVAKRPVTGLMIENSTDARPQSGLDKAGIVFEAIAEGGVTRFLALFQESSPDYIGPVRSARPYYVEWAKTFDASYGHVGGSPDALALIKSLSVKDIDQFANGGSYQRITSRAAPHNVYTDFVKLDALNEKKGYTSSSFTVWPRKTDVPQTPTANTIDLSVSGPTYSPKFSYDISTNSYKRAQAGQPHLVLAKDLKTTSQINPKVVIALVMSYGLDSDGYHSAYKTTGSGKIYVFQDGIVSTGTWSKPDAQSQFVFTDKNGLPMLLNRGQTWVTAVGSESAVSYKP